LTTPYGPVVTGTYVDVGKSGNLVALPSIGMLAHGSRDTLAVTGK
jgi:hypothetical protein